MLSITNSLRVLVLHVKLARSKDGGGKRLSGGEVRKEVVRIVYGEEGALEGDGTLREKGLGGLIAGVFIS